MMKKKHVSIRVRGLVQGVFFRASTRAEAGRLNVAGFVRNERDGSVYIEAEGDEPALSGFLDWCRRGPAGANVESCEVFDSELKGYAGFRIER